MYGVAFVLLDDLTLNRAQAGLSNCKGAGGCTGGLQHGIKDVDLTSQSG